MTGRASLPMIEPLLPDERLSQDDQAARREAEHLACAVAAQQRRAATAAHSTPGICSNCGEACAGLAVYCDLECRGEHETRLKRQARTGQGRG
jgi:hypothetical protein